MEDSAEIVGRAARRLELASTSGIPCDPVRDLIGSADVALAYRVQRTLTERRLSRGAQAIGRKIGLTSVAVQRQLGVDQPDFGVLFEDMHCRQGDSVPPNHLLQPKIEAEIAFVLSDDLDHDVLDIGRVRAAVAYAVAALEIVDSRVRNWDIAITDTVADNASSGMFVLGSRKVELHEFEPAEIEMSLTSDLAVVSAGTGRACLGDPLTALQWLAETARKYGSPLRAGEVVLSGALGPMVPVASGSNIRADFSVLGQVSVSFS